jgi:hypothetical protein
VDFTRNPYPPGYVGNIENFHFPEKAKESTSSQFETGLKLLVRKGNPFRFRG